MAAFSFMHPASINIDAAQFVYALAKFLKPQIILEIGCFVGFSTIHLAQALKENGKGKILAVDFFNPRTKVVIFLKKADGAEI